MDIALDKLWYNSDVAAFLGNKRFPGRGAVCANDEGQTGTTQ